MARYWGINAFGHDASLCVVEDNVVLYHKKSGDEYLNQTIIDEALSLGKPDSVCYYEKPFLKRLRHLYSGDFNNAFSLLTPKLHLMEFGIVAPMRYIHHHESHAAGAYFSSDVDNAVILVADAIGEWETVTVWYGSGNKLTKLKSYFYPFSLGLFYTAFSKFYGVSEGELMRLSKSGKPTHYSDVQKLLTTNLHKGIKSFDAVDSDLPCSVQTVFVDWLKDTLTPYRRMSPNLIMSGGCAYNADAVKILGAKVCNNPGDAGSSIGAVAAFVKSKITNCKGGYATSS